MIFYYVWGVTCAGKDTLMDRADELYPSHVGLVNVGKEFRKRYPPSHFNGQGALQSTEVEAREIFEEQINVRISEGKRLIFISGQPRMVSQIPFTMDKYPGTLLWMHVSSETLLKRLEGRFPGDPGAFELSKKRLTNDRIQLYDVLFDVIKKGYPIITFNGDFEQIDTLIHNLIHFQGDT